VLKKLTEEKQRQIIDCAISEFADKGFTGAGMSAIAKSAGISVGVLYKYYDDKKALFLACVRLVVGNLEEFLSQLTAKSDKPLNYARALVTELQAYSKRHGDYIRLYHEITGTDKFAPELVCEIEGYTAALYTRIISDAQKEGNLRNDLDPGLFAMFFDNLLMMMQFSYSCPYYMERFRLYAGDETQEDDGYFTDQLVRFLESAFTLAQSDIKHN